MSAASNSSEGAGGGYLWAAESAYLCAFYLAQVSATLSAYVTVVLCVWRTPRFHTSGYALLLSLFTAEMAASVSWHYFGTLPIALHYRGLLTYSYEFGLRAAFVENTGYYTAALHLLAISAQRYVSVAHFSAYRKLATRTVTAAVIAALWICGAMISLVCYIGPCQFFFSPVYFGLAYNFGHPVTQTWNSIDTGFGVTVATLLLTFCTLFLYKLWKIRKTSSINAQGYATAAGGSRNKVAASGRPQTRSGLASSSVPVATGPSAASSGAVGGVAYVERGGAVGTGNQPSAGGESSMKDETRLSLQVLVIAGWWALAAIQWIVVNVVISGRPLSVTATKLVWGAQAVIWIWVYGLDPVLILAMNRTLRRTARNTCICTRPG